MYCTSVIRSFPWCCPRVFLCTSGSMLFQCFSLQFLHVEVSLVSNQCCSFGIFVRYQVFCIHNKRGHITDPRSAELGPGGTQNRICCMFPHICFSDVRLFLLAVLVLLKKRNTKKNYQFMFIE